MKVDAYNLLHTSLDTPMENIPSLDAKIQLLIKSQIGPKVKQAKKNVKSPPRKRTLSRSSLSLLLS